MALGVLCGCVESSLVVALAELAARAAAGLRPRSGDADGHGRRSAADRAPYAPGAAVGVGDRGTRGDARPAGPEAMRDPHPDRDAVDEAVDETFPASDPTTTY